MDDYGFMITRHVNSEKTNRYWNRCVQCIRKLYPLKKIVIIDDNSNSQYVKPEFDYQNVEIIVSEYPRRGELLPYYYFYKHRFFNNAVIIHDSVFFHKRIPFEKMKELKVLPLWHFNKDKEDIHRTMNLAYVLSNSFMIQQKLNLNDNVMGLNHDKWYGCFGVQSYINLDFLIGLVNKYNLFQLLNVVTCRQDRCSLERIFGILFYTECCDLLKRKSLLGDIFHYQRWGYSFEEYVNDVKQKRLPRYTVKIWTGR
jgi:hypothetical protein